MRKMLIIIAIRLGAASLLAFHGGGHVAAHGPHMHGNGGCSQSEPALAMRAGSDALKDREHADFERLFNVCEATHSAIASGEWTDPAIWRNGLVPTHGAKAHIPGGLVVSLDRAPDGDNFVWIRIDGDLLIAPKSPMRLSFETLVVGNHGSLAIGTQEHPIRRGTAVELTVLPRSTATRTHDPMDLAGGVIVHGTFSIFGAQKTAFVAPTNEMRKGTTAIVFPEPLHGWHVGDQLLFPAARRKGQSSVDEVIGVGSISPDRRTVTLEAPLQSSHVVPRGVPALPVANLTRDVTIRSQSTRVISDRGHMMVMHSQSGVHIEGAALHDLGRTVATAVHTFPRLGDDGHIEDGTAANTIGRYALHFHMRSGAMRSTPPHVVRGSVVVGSPKHGIVNHGGHVIAEDNVTYRIDGSHFFAENGTEIGAFRHNLAVRSQGSGSLTLARDAVYDFGHEGHGIWSQSAAVEITDNWAIGHAGGAIVVFGYPVKEGGEFVYFDAHNAPGHEPDSPNGLMAVSSPSFTLSGNKVGASRSGVEIWNHKIYAKNEHRSLIERTVVWDVLLQGIFLPYTRNVVIREAQLFGGVAAPFGMGVSGNDLTEAIHIENARVSGFVIGIRMPGRGDMRLANIRLANATNVEIGTATKPGRKVRLENISFQSLELSDEPVSLGAKFSDYLAGLTSAFHRIVGTTAHAPPTDIVMRDLVVPVNGDAAMLFADDWLYLTDASHGERQIFFQSQAPAAIPFVSTGPAILRGVSSSEMARKHGIVRAGVLAPRDATPLLRSNALISMKVEGADQSRAMEKIDPAGLDEHDKYMLLLEAQYPGAFHHFSRKVTATADDDWALGGDVQLGPYLVFRDKTPPHFILQPSLRDASIHPLDVKYGYRVQGMVYDKVGSVVSMRAFTQDFFDLEVDADGVVRLHFDIHDMAGNVTPVDLPLKVSTTAKRRGSHLSYFMEGQCILCEYNQMNREAGDVFGREIPLVVAQ